MLRYITVQGATIQLLKIDSRLGCYWLWWGQLVRRCWLAHQMPRVFCQVSGGAGRRGHQPLVSVSSVPCVAHHPRKQECPGQGHYGFAGGKECWDLCRSAYIPAVLRSLHGPACFMPRRVRSGAPGRRLRLIVKVVLQNMSQPSDTAGGVRHRGGVTEWWSSWLWFWRSVFHHALHLCATRWSKLHI